MFTTDAAAGRRETTSRNRARLLATPLDVSLLGQPLRADLYARNGFRLVGMSASADDVALETAIQKFRNFQRLSPSAAMGRSISLGYELPLCREDALESLARLKDPRHRLVSELFWPHLAAERFTVLGSTRQMANDHLVAALEAGAKGSGRDAALARHALAVIFHNRAITEELQPEDGKDSTAAWSRALDCWAQVVDSDAFWEYIQERGERLDDPRVRRTNVDAAREQLPIALLAWQSLFVSTYSLEWRPEDIHRHFSLIHDCSFREEPKQTAVSAVAGSLTKTRLEPLIDRLREATSGTAKISRRQAREALSPVLDEALKLRRFLASESRRSGDELEVAEFDALAEEGLRVVSGDKLDYTDEQPRALLFSVVATRKLLSLPLSKPMRRKVQSGLDRDIALLYRGFLPDWAGTDPSQCWFLKCEEADSEAAILLPVYRVTKVTNRGVRWEQRQVVVPRSERARAAHEGLATVPDVASLPEEILDEESRRLVSQIRQCEAETRGAIDHESHAMQAEVKAAEDDLMAALAQQTARVAGQVARDKVHLEDVMRRHDALLAPEIERHRHAIALAREKAAGPISHAEEGYNKALEANRGLRGLFRAKTGHLATLGAAYCPVVAAASFWLPPTSAMATVIVVALLMLAYLVAARSRRLAAANRPVVEARRALVAEEEALERQHMEARSMLARGAEQEGAEATARLAAVDAETGRVRSDGVARVAQIREVRQASMRQIQQRASVASERLHEALATRVKPKPETEKSRFPAYLKAKSSGYRDGSGPSQSEVEGLIEREVKTFMDSLSVLERQRFVRLLSALSPNQREQFLNSLFDRPPAERRRSLQDIPW
jgi:hypothetical protein